MSFLKKIWENGGGIKMRDCSGWHTCIGSSRPNGSCSGIRIPPCKTVDMNPTRWTILAGKVLLLVSIIFIFSYVNMVYDKAEKKEYEKSLKENNNPLVERGEKYNNIDTYDKFTNLIEGFGGEKDRKRWWGEAKQAKCIFPISVVFKIPIWIVTFLLKVVIWVLKFLYAPIQFILRSLLGNYFDIIILLGKAIYKIYEIILIIFFRIFTIIFRIIYTIINVFFIVLFAIIPNILLNLLSIILSLPFVIFGFLSPFFRIFRFLGVICWSKNGLYNDLLWVRNKILTFNFENLVPRL